MDWGDLKFVLTVARERTLAAAGRKLRVDPTTVGRRVLAIEEQLGVRLFDRTGEGYLMTNAGRIATRHAEKVEGIVGSLEQQIEGADRRVEGPVRITALDALFDALLIPALPAFIARYPGLELTLSSSFDTIDLSKREADIAIRPSKPVEPDFIGRKLGRAAMAVYAARHASFSSPPPLIGLPRDREHLPLRLASVTAVSGKPYRRTSQYRAAHPSTDARGPGTWSHRLLRGRPRSRFATRQIRAHRLLRGSCGNPHGPPQPSARAYRARLPGAGLQRSA